MYIYKESLIKNTSNLYKNRLYIVYFYIFKSFNEYIKLYILVKNIALYILLIYNNTYKQINKINGEKSYGNKNKRNVYKNSF